MSKYDGSIIINVQIDTSAVETGLQKNVKQAANKASNAANDLGNSFDKAETHAQAATESMEQQLNNVELSLKDVASALGVAFSFDQIVNFGSAAIETASDLQEVQNVVDTAFGEMAGQVNQFASTAITNFGMSELAAKQTAGQFMSMSTALGISQQEAANMSLSVTGLTGDMASFYNVSQDVAQTALASIWTGETESLKRFGIVMTQTNLEQYAMQQGIRKTMDQMTQAEQVQLRYNYVMEQTALAQGDFVKTQDSWANQSRILDESLTALQGTIGEGLMSAMTPLLETVNGIVSGLIGFQESTGLIDDFFTVLLGGLAGLTAMKGIALIQSLATALMMVGESAMFAKLQSGLVAVAVGALAVLILQLINAWSGMTGLEKVVAVLGLVAAAAVTAAIAVGAFQSALTLGIGIAAIAAGIFAVVAALNSAQKRAEQISNSMQISPHASATSISTYSIPALATGAVIPPNREFLAVLGDQKAGINIETPLSTMVEAFNRALDARGGTGGGQQTVILEVDKKVLGRVTYQVNKEESRRIGVNLVGV